jgi:hypothetical protein
MVLTEDRSLQELKLMSSELNFEKVRFKFEPGTKLKSSELNFEKVRSNFEPGTKLKSSELNFEKVRSNFEPGAAAGLSSNSGFLSDP